MTRLKHLTLEQQRHIIALWGDGKTRREIEQTVRLSQITIAEVLRVHFSKLKRIEKQTAFRPDISPVDYSGHDEVNRHYAGCEFEDTRPLHERGKAWPPQ